MLHFLLRSKSKPNYWRKRESLTSRCQLCFFNHFWTHTTHHPTYPMQLVSQYKSCEITLLTDKICGNESKNHMTSQNYWIFQCIFLFPNIWDFVGNLWVYVFFRFWQFCTHWISKCPYIRPTKMIKNPQVWAFTSFS